MDKRRPFVLLGLLAFALLVSVALGSIPAAASPEEHYSGPYFGEDNFPPGCIRDMSRLNPDNICHHMRTDLNALDSPKVDVLVMVPVSPTAERDMRIMRQSVEMWEGGIDYLAGQMGLDWLAAAGPLWIPSDRPSASASTPSSVRLRSNRRRTRPHRPCALPRPGG